MVFKIDFDNEKAILWSKEKGKTTKEVVEDYNPSFYISGENLLDLRVWLSRKEGVKATKFEKWYTDLKDKDKSRVLRVDVSKPEKVSKTAHRVISNFPRQNFRFYNISFTPQFRFCLQRKIEPIPSDLSDLAKMRISLSRRGLGQENISELKLNGNSLGKTEEDVLRELNHRIERIDPDILFVNNGQILPILRDKVKGYGFNFSLGRRKGLEKLAGENTVSSYGKTVHSSARYNIDGRILIDEANSFLLGEATLEGLWDLVERSWKPLQELAWGSIGRLLTAIEIREAYLERDLLTSWKNWDGENFKSARTLHKADRGGYIFNPEPEIHEDVYEADFASLFPNIMVKKNISPETVDCNCCDNSKVPELDYSICEGRRGFISEVLKPLVEDRQEMKERLRDENLEPEMEKYLKGSVDAIKWILVSCFGYMGHAHASYGAIECHQAIQSFDRQIMGRTKDRFYENGYQVVHGIIDSIWVQERNDSSDIKEVCKKITEEIGIELEYEDKFQWVAFVPRKTKKADIGTLNRYFGVKENGEIKTAGIEAEQRTTPEYIKDCQEMMIRSYHENREPRDVLEVLKQQIMELQSGGIRSEDLVIKKRASKPLEAYSQNTRTVSALKRYRSKGIDIGAGQDVEFVVYDNQRKDRDRVRLSFEEFVGYDEGFYVEKLINAAESILSPMGWGENRIKGHISNSNKVPVSDFW